MIRIPAIFLALAIVGCGSTDRLWTLSEGRPTAFATADRLVYVHGMAGVVTILDPTGTTQPTQVEVDQRTRAVATTATSILTIGGRGDAPALHLVSTASPDAPRRIALPGAYDRIATAPSGTHAVLFYDPTATPAAGSPAARNNNELSIVDLGAGTIATFSLRSESVAPQDVVFDPTGALAAIVLDGAVAIVTLTNPEARVLVPLKLAGGQVLAPREVVFSPDGAFVYVRAAGTDDVLALEVTRTDGELGAALNFLFFAGGAGLRDILVPSSAGFERYVAALYDDGSRRSLALLDARGDAQRTHAASLIRSASQLADLGQGRLLAFGVGAGIAGWEPLTDRLDEDQLPGTPSGAPVVVPNGAFFTHPLARSDVQSTALTGVTVTDDGARLRLRLAPIVLAAQPAALATNGAAGSLIAAVPIQRFESGAAPLDTDEDDFAGTVGSIVVLHPDSLALGGVVLDENVERVGVVGGHLFAQHPSKFGDVTFVPLAKLERAEAKRVSGFLAGRLLDLGEGK